MPRISLTRLYFLICFSLLSSVSLVRATNLSNSLNETEVKKAIDVFGFGSVHKPWTAHALPGGSLGLDMGFEADFIFRSGIENQGDETAVVPRIVPAPKFWFSWDLPAQFMVSGSFAPGVLFDGITAFGAAVQWTFERITDWATSSSVMATYTYSNSFDDITAQSLGVDLQFSRDLLAWQPYAAFGFNMMSASVATERVDPGVKTSGYLRWAHHIAFGARVDFLAKLSFQMDLYNFRPGVSVLLSTSF